MSFSKKIDSTRPELIFLVRGQDSTGAASWYYVLVDKSKQEKFKRQNGASSLDLDEYGRVIYSGFGENPPESVRQLIKEEYAFQD